MLIILCIAIKLDFKLEIVYFLPDIFGKAIKKKRVLEIRYCMQQTLGQYCNVFEHVLGPSGLEQNLRQYSILLAVHTVSLTSMNIIYIYVCVCDV